MYLGGLMAGGWMKLKRASARSSRYCLVASSWFLVAGCGAMDTGALQAQSHWKTATVVQVASAERIDWQATHDCRVAGAGEHATARYAVLTYAYLRGQHSVIVPLSPNSPIKAGDAVRVQVDSCAAL